MHLIKYIFLLVFLFSVNNLLLSQEDNCLASLQKAQKLYNQGLIEDIAGLLQPCIESGFTRNQRVEAYKLIILASLLDGNQELAENTMIEFLKRNPEYEIMSDDPVEFVYLFESYRTLSVFSVGLKFGPNLTNPRIIEPFSSGDLSNSSSSDKTGVGFQAGLSVNRYIAKHLFLNLEITYYSNSYKFVDEYISIDQSVSTVVTYKENIKRYDIPLSIGYEIESKLFNYFIRGGISYSSLIKATHTPTIEQNSEIKNGAEEDITEFRTKQNFLYHFGGGIKYKVPRGYLIADVRFNGGLKNLAIENKRYENITPVMNFYHVDDNFSINSFTFSLGYYFSFYQPKKN